MMLQFVIALLFFLAVLMIFRALFMPKSTRTIIRMTRGGDAVEAQVPVAGFIEAFFKPITSTFTNRMSGDQRRNLEVRLRRAGNPYEVSTYYTYHLVGATIGLFMGLFFGNFLFGPSLQTPLAGVAGAVFGYFYVDLRLREMIAHRSGRIYRDWPVFLDNFAAMVASGIMVNEAISRIANAYQGPLFLELKDLHKNLTMQALGTRAWELFALYCGVPFIDDFVEGIILSYRGNLDINRQAKQFLSAAIAVRDARRADRKAALPGRMQRSMLFMVIFTLPSFMAIILVPILGQVFLNFTA